MLWILVKQENTCSHTEDVENYSKIFITSLWVSKHLFFTEFQNPCRGRSANLIHTLWLDFSSQNSVVLEVSYQSECKIQQKGSSPIGNLAFIQRCGPPSSRPSHFLRKGSQQPQGTRWFSFRYWNPNSSGNNLISFCSLFQKILFPFTTFSTRPHKDLLHWPMCGNKSAKGPVSAAPLHLGIWGWTKLL